VSRSAGSAAVDVLLVSNGHGEDVIAARVAQALRDRAPELELAAMPLVGLGEPYRDADVHVLDPRARLPSGGFTLHDPVLAWRDLRAGLVRLTLGQLRTLRGLRPRGVVVVGDVYAQTLATLVPAPRIVYQPLVSVRMMTEGEGVAWNRSFMERILAPERRLMAAAFARVYARDEATARWLRAHGVPQAAFVGNPMMDALDGDALPVPDGCPCVALLPGTRSQAERSVAIMLAAVARLERAVALVAWTHPDVPAPLGWELEPCDLPGVVAAHRSGGVRVWWVRGRFADVLASAQAVVGTAGTAQEQAAGLGLPVVSFPLPPAYRPEYLRNQHRLLGGALRIVESDPETLAAAVRQALADGPHRAEARRDGPAAMGPPGAAAAIAADTVAWLNRRARPP
jgi:uncharacterized protein (TIGR03492 family)